MFDIKEVCHVWPGKVPRLARMKECHVWRRACHGWLRKSVEILPLSSKESVVLVGEKTWTRE